MAYKPNDYFAQKAKKEGFKARSVYKLMEIDKKYKLFKKGMQVIDLGAFPDSWTQYISGVVGDGGKVLAIDIQAIEIKLPNVVVVVEDIYKIDIKNVLEKNGFENSVEVVVSDMAPATTGVKVTDQARSLALCEMAFEVAKIGLMKGGSFVCKLFDSGDTQGFKKALQMVFKEVVIFRAKSTRTESKEIFLVGLSRL